MNKPGFFAGLLLSSLVSRSVRVLLATLVGTAISVASTVAASVLLLLHQSGLTSTVIAMLSSSVAGFAAVQSSSGAAAGAAAPRVRVDDSVLRGGSWAGPRAAPGSDFAGGFGGESDDLQPLVVPPYAR
jgi:hypothetical protein